MVIRNNINGKRSHRYYGAVNTELSKTLEKLSSGYRINRASDDAAGLAISEKMRLQIVGLGRAKENSEEGIQLVQTGEGALQEVHDLLDRAEYLAGESANGTYMDELDRENLQKELDHIRSEIDRITSSANFNGIKLFQDQGLEYERGISASDPAAAQSRQELERLERLKRMVSQELRSEVTRQQAHRTVSNSTQAHPAEMLELADSNMILDELKSTTRPGEFNIVYIEDELVNAEQKGTNSLNGNTYENDKACDIPVVGADGGEKKLSEVLKGEIIPNIVESMLQSYPAFGYLDGSTIGIGMRLYDENTTTLASVMGALGTNTQYYMLSVNIHTLKGTDGKISDEARTELETTIAHEMMHAFMDEATTAGMFGSDGFPGWFVEGMAQTAAGPNTWLKPDEVKNLPDGSTVTTSYGGLKIDGESSDNVIKKAIADNKLEIGRLDGSNASKYGTGYLACMYLGAAISAQQADKNLNNAAGKADANSISGGLNQLLSAVIQGDSLDKAINDLTGGEFSSTRDFQDKFNAGSADGMLPFVRNLLTNTGSGLGGLATGDLHAADLAENSVKTNVKLFTLHADHTLVENTYDSRHVVETGGTLSTSGTAPVELHVNPVNVFTITGGTEGTDYCFDPETQTLRILSNVPLEISGGTSLIDGRTEYGTIEIADNVNAEITLNGVQIDATKVSGNAAGIQLGNGSKVTLNMKGENTIIGSGESAGIQLFGDYKKDSASVKLEDSSLTINMQAGSKLTAKGGTNDFKGGAGIGTAWATDSSTSTIKITGTGTLDVEGGMGGAGIGGSEGGEMGDIVIEGSGLTIKSVGGNHGAGIGAGGWVSTYNEPEEQKVGDITITGSVDITASSMSHGTGIGGACHSGVGNITIGDEGVSDENIKICAKGGNDGAAIGSGWAGKMGTLTIKSGTIYAEAGNNGAGIGSGKDARTTAGENGGDIIIKGGTITAIGAAHASGIGSGVNGNVSAITISGGTISAKGGWTNDGGNIGGYGLDGKEIKVKVTDPEGVEIKAGPGEGLYVTTGTVDEAGNSLYALKLDYLNELLSKSTVDSVPPGSKALKFPVTIKATLSDGTEYEWTDLQHRNVEEDADGTVAIDKENNAYIWMKGNDVTLEVSYKGDDNKTTYTVKAGLKFFGEYGLWRYSEEDLPAEKPQKPEQVPATPVQPDPPGPDQPDPSGPDQPDSSEPDNQVGGIILQIGANYGETLEIPRFYLSAHALGLDDISIATQDRALEAMGVLRDAINRVSSVRGSYGALQNRLKHNINDLAQTRENISDAESRIRDADMAEEYIKMVKLNILQQSSQAMMAHSNEDSERILQLLQ